MNPPREYAEAADWLRCSDSVLRKAVAAGKVPYSKPFGKVLFTEDDLEAILADAAFNPRPAPKSADATVTEIRKGKSTARKGRAA